MDKTALGLNGYGDEYGSGSGSGYGSGYGYGDGSGYGSGDVARCTPSRIRITAEHLIAAAACIDELRSFRRLFPDGAIWPDDEGKARVAGLNVEWAKEKMGLLAPTGEAA